jgi:hypothetical protein
MSKERKKKKRKIGLPAKVVLQVAKSGVYKDHHFCPAGPTLSHSTRAQDLKTSYTHVNHAPTILYWNNCVFSTLISQPFGLCSPMIVSACVCLHMALTSRQICRNLKGQKLCHLSWRCYCTGMHYEWNKEDVCIWSRYGQIWLSLKTKEDYKVITRHDHHSTKRVLFNSIQQPSYKQPISTISVSKNLSSRVGGSRVTESSGMTQEEIGLAALKVSMIEVKVSCWIG